MKVKSHRNQKINSGVSIRHTFGRVIEMKALFTFCTIIQASANLAFFQKKSIFNQLLALLRPHTVPILGWRIGAENLNTGKHCAGGIVYWLVIQCCLK